MAAKECPMCGESMHLRKGDVTERVPGTAETKTREFHEWVCPECDYFEDVDAEDLEDE